MNAHEVGHYTCTVEYSRDINRLVNVDIDLRCRAHARPCKPCIAGQTWIFSDPREHYFKIAVSYDK